MHIIQKELLKMIREENLGKMTLREVGKRLGGAHPQVVRHHLYQLVKKGLIKIDKSQKSITLVKTGENTKDNLIYIPILGSANCGLATIIAEEKIEGMLPLSHTLLSGLNKKSLFAVKAVGNSLNKADIDNKGTNIEEGDYVLIDGANRKPRNNQYILSIIDGLANIKRFYFNDQNKQIILISDSSDEIPPIYIHKNDLVSYMINGVVVRVIKRPKDS